MCHHRLLICSLVLLVLPVVALADDLPDPRVISVEGQAEIQVVPDEVVLTLGFESFDPSLQSAKEDNDRRLKAVLDAARRLGVEERHLETDYLSIEPSYYNRYKNEDESGFTVRRSLVITLRQIEHFERLLAAALEAGANHVHGVQFRTTELRKHRDQARELAVQAAKEKAIAMAAVLGQEIGRPTRIEERHSGWYSPYSWWWRGRNNSMSQNVIQAAPSGGSGASDGPNAPGQIAVSASVTVSFEMKE